MPYDIPNTDPRSMSTEELTAELDSFAQLGEVVAVRMSLLLSELRRRRQPSPHFHHPILRFFQALADGKLHPRAAIALAHRDMIKAVLPLPPKQQLAIARGEPVPVATLTDTGEIKSDDIPIRRMDPATLKRAFGPDGIRTVHEQAEMIRAAGKVQRIGAISVLHDEQVIKAGNMKLRPEDLRAPLRALGWRLIGPREGSDHE